MYCVLYHIHQDKIKKNAFRVSNYEPYLNDFNWNEIKFPVELKDISKVEKLIKYGINVFGYDKSVHPLRITDQKDDKIINLLLITNSVKGETINHFVYIKKLDVLVSPVNRDKDGKHVAKKSFVCVNCLHCFSTSDLLKNHRENGCDKFEPTKTVLPILTKVDDKYVIPTIQFEHHRRKLKEPVVIYADFETFVINSNNTHDSKKSSTTKIAELPPNSFNINVVSDYPELNLGMTSYRGKEGEDITEIFLKCLLKQGDIIKSKINAYPNIDDMIITQEQQKQFDECNMCYICEKPILEDRKKVRDYDHINGLYRGCAHSVPCNINLNEKNFKIPTYFHNLKGFDGHLIIQGLKKMNFSKIKIISQNFEKYMSFEFGNFRFLDSFAFMSSSLEKLSENLLADGKF
jgi:hypothetical protein